MVKAQVPVRTSSALGDFAALARDLRRAGAGGLERELYKGMGRVSRHLKPAVIESAKATLPKGGGRGRRRTRMVDTGRTLTNAVSGRTHVIKERRKLGGSLAPAESVVDRVVAASYQARISRRGGLRLRFTATERSGKKIDLARLDEGRLRHMTFGRGTSKAGKSLWFDQAVPAGWFSRPLEAKAPEIEQELRAAVDAVVAEINRA